MGSTYQLGRTDTARVAARVVNENAPHQSSGDGVEVRTVLPMNTLLVNEP